MHNKINAMASNIFRRIYKNLFVTIVVIPLSLVSIYYLFLANNLYQSESKVVVRKSADSVGQFAGFSIPLLGSIGGASNEDALFLREYILSPDMADKLNSTLNLKKEFSLKGVDFPESLPSWASKEDFYEFYRKRVQVHYDEKTGVLIVRGIATSPEFAKKLNQEILKESELFINEVSHRIVREQNDFAAKEVARAKQQLDLAKEKLIAFQNTQKMIDPAVSAEITNRLIAEIQAKLSSKEIELQTMSVLLQNDAAQMIALRQEISSLKLQLEDERKKLTSPQDVALNRMAAKYQEYKATLDFHIELYKLALTGLEKMRVESARKIKTLAVLSNPFLPEDEKYPRRWYQIGLWAFCLVMLFGFVRLALEIVEDHRV